LVMPGNGRVVICSIWGRASNTGQRRSGTPFSA